MDSAGTVPGTHRFRSYGSRWMVMKIEMMVETPPLLG